MSGLPPAARERLRTQLAFLYGDKGTEVSADLLRLLESFSPHAGPAPSEENAPTPRPARDAVSAARAGERLSEREVVLITYADGVRSAGEAPLVTLRSFLRRHIADTVSTIHLLPFYPASSDDGFSVIDYEQVDPSLGSWEDVSRLGADYGLMFDAVINHVSAGSAYFQGFLAGEAPYRDFFITADPEVDLSMVVRPRTSKLLTPFPTRHGTAHVWTTFSADQVDLNYGNPRVLLEIVRVLLGYVARGAGILRLDAVTYLWKEPGTSCANHPKTHGVLRVLRTVMDAVAPHVTLLTETNVPHAENVAYFGDGSDEATMVYNFALPPLVLHTFGCGDSALLSEWARSLAAPSSETCFFNFLASHDGIGLRPVEGILSAEALAALVERVVERGGRISYRSGGRNDAGWSRGRSDGSDAQRARPYELNIALFDALNDPRAREPLGRQVDRVACAHAMMLALPGVPGIYLHALLGSRSDHEAVRATGRNRAVNRSKLARDSLEAELRDRGSRRALVLARLQALLRARRSRRAFHPQAPHRVLEAGAGVFAIHRATAARGVLCLHDVSGEGAKVSPAQLAEAVGLRSETLVDLLTGEPPPEDARARMDLAPYGVAWLHGAAAA